MEIPEETRDPPATTPASAPGLLTAPSPYPPWLVIGSWAFYDLANTIFSAIVVTRYFSPYIVLERGMAMVWFSAANIISLFASGLVSPHCGTFMDRVGHGRLLLFLSTLACVLATALLGLLQDPWLLLAAFALANFFYNVALVFYNVYLPYLGPPEKQGKISGIGTGVGYLGIIPALLFAGFLKARGWGTGAVFVMAAIAFLLLSVPALLTLPRIPRSPRAGQEHPLRELLGIAREIAGDRDARNFFIGNFLCTDVLNALIIWIFVFVPVVFHFSDAEQDGFQVAMVLSNILCSFIVGWLSDRFTARRAFLLSAVSLFLALLVAGCATSPSIFFWATVPLSGFALGGIWTAGRKLLFELTPPGRLGAYSGIYGLTGKVSTFTSLLYGALASLGANEPWAHRVAILSLALPAAAGFWFLRAVREPARRAVTLR